MRLDEINARLAAIANEIDAASGETLTSLEQEVRQLKQERDMILGETRRRQQLRQDVASGVVSGNPLIPRSADPETPAYTLESEEYRTAFLRHLRREDMSAAEQRAFTFLTTNTAAPLPTAMQNRIIDLIGEEHPIVADVYTMNSGCAISIPVATAINADAGKTNEGAAANELQVSFSDITLSGEDYTANVKMSYKMVYMAIPAFEDYLVTLIAGRVGAKLAEGIVAKIKAKIHVDNKIDTGVNYANICAGFGALKRVSNTVVYGTRKGVYTKLVSMVDASKRPIFQNAMTEKAAGAVLGAIIKFEDAVGDTELLIGDPSKFVQNVVTPILIERDKNLDDHKMIYSGYTLQEGTLTDDKAFALVSESAAV